MALEDGQIAIEKLSDSFQIDFTQRIDILSSEFATAYDVRSFDTENADSKSLPKYALVFAKNFPIDIEKIYKAKELNSKTLGIVYEVGKATNTTNATEHLAVILSKPSGQTLTQIFTEMGALDENFVLNMIFEKLFNAIFSLHSQNIIHGTINPDNIFYNTNTSEVYLKESYSEYPGYSQKPVFETFERVVCHKAAKNPYEFEADYYALGISIIAVLFGMIPLQSLEAEEVIESKMQNGSYDAVYLATRQQKSILVSPKGENIIKGLIHDKTRDRWGAREIKSWMKREAGQAIVSKLHRQTANTFEFNGKEFYSPKYLAKTLQTNWQAAKKFIKLNELSRWLNLSVKDPEIEKKIFALTREGRSEVILPDEKVSRIIYIMDPEGPIRFKNTSVTVLGIGNYLSYIMAKNDTEALEEFVELLSEGLIEGWITQQTDQTPYKLTNLGWTPRKMRIFARKAAIGFGLERCLYEMSPLLPCQSPLLEKYYVISIPSMLRALNNIKTNFKNSEPMDNHIAAYVCKHLEIEDTIKVKQLAAFPYISKMRAIEVASLLALAQRKYNVTGLNNLNMWVREMLNEVVERLNSANIKQALQENLDNAAQNADLHQLFLTAIDPNFIARDINGFNSAKRQYKVLKNERVKLLSQRNLDKMAFRVGLRISVLVAYLICSIAILAVVFLSL